jgi:hypothetical protein
MKENSRDTLELLLLSLFDYAGMFPPAGRSFHEALKESASLPTSLTRPGMLSSDLVLDIEHARKLITTDLRAHGFSRDISMCLLASETPQRTLEVATGILTTTCKDGLRVSISSLEAKVVIEGISPLIETFLPFTQQNSILLALEPDLSTSDWQANLKSTLSAIKGTGIALKCRCSAPTGIGPERLSAAIIEACDNNTPFKVTGGLHHPIVERERYDNNIGFLNLAAGVLLRRAKGEQLSHTRLLALLTNPSFQAITTGETLAYDGISISYDQAAHAKSAAPFSIGSCSLHEPDADIERLFSRAT